METAHVGGRTTTCFKLMAETSYFLFVSGEKIRSASLTFPQYDRLEVVITYFDLSAI